MSRNTAELLNPVAKVSIKQGTVQGSLETMKGKRIGVCETYKEWRGFALFMKRTRELLTDRHGVGGFAKLTGIVASTIATTDPHASQMEQKEFGEFAKKINGAIVGAGF